MPSGYTLTVPNDVLQGPGVLSVGGILVGVSRGGLSWGNDKEWRNAQFDGQSSPVMGLDRVVSLATRFAGTFLTLSTADLARYETAEAVGTNNIIPAAVAPGVAAAFRYAPGDSLATATVVRASTATYLSSGLLLAEGRYVSDVRVTFKRGAGLYVVVFPRALCTKWSWKGVEKGEGELAAEFEARIDLLSVTSTPDTDLAPYTVEIS